MSYLSIYTNNLNKNSEIEQRIVSDDEEIQDQMRFRYLKLNTENAIKILSGLPTVVSAIDFSHNQINIIPDCLCVSLLALDLSFNTIEFPVISVKNYHNLIELNISNNKISDLTGLTTSGLISLEYLNVSSNLINQISGLENMTSLKALKLEHNNIVNFSSLRSLSYNSLLRDIYLEGNIITGDKYFKIKLLNSIPSLKSIDGVPIRKRISLQSKVVNDGLRYSDLCTTTSNTGGGAATLSTAATTTTQSIYDDVNTDNNLDVNKDVINHLWIDDRYFDDPLQYATKMIMNASSQSPGSQWQANMSSRMSQNIQNNDIYGYTNNNYTNNNYTDNNTNKYSTCDIKINTNLDSLPWRKPPSIAPKSLKNIDKTLRNKCNDSTITMKQTHNNNNNNNISGSSKSQSAHHKRSKVVISSKHIQKHKDKDNVKETIIKYELPSPWMAPILNTSSSVATGVDQYNMSLILPLPSSLFRNTSPATIRKVANYSNTIIPTMPNYYSSSSNSVLQMPLESHSPQSKYYNDHSYLNASIAAERSSIKSVNRHNINNSRNISPLVSPTRSSLRRQEYIHNNVNEKQNSEINESELINKRTYRRVNRQFSRSISPLVSPTRSSLRRQEYIHNNVNEKQNSEINESELINKRTYRRVNRQFSRSISPASVSPTRATLKRQEYISNKVYEIQNVENNELELINNRTYRSLSTKPGTTVATNRKTNRSRSPYAKERTTNKIRESKSLNRSDTLLNAKEIQQKHHLSSKHIENSSNDLNNKSTTVVTLEENESPYKRFVKLRDRISTKYAPPSQNVLSISSSSGTTSEQHPQQLGYSESKKSSHTYDFAHKINPDDVDAIFKENAMKQKYFDELQVIESKVDSLQLQERLLQSDILMNNNKITTTTTSDQTYDQNGYGLLYSMIQQRKSILENIAPPPPPPSALLLSYTTQQFQTQPNVSVNTTTAPSQSIMTIANKEQPAISTSNKTTTIIASSSTMQLQPPGGESTTTPSSCSTSTTHTVSKKLNSPSPLKKATQDTTLIFDAINKLKSHQAASFQALHSIITTTTTNNNTSTSSSSSSKISTSQTKTTTSSTNIPTSNTLETATIRNNDYDNNNSSNNINWGNGNTTNNSISHRNNSISHRNNSNSPKALDHTSNSFFQRFAENNPYMKQLSLNNI